jgi:hypothetical protein
MIVAAEDMVPRCFDAATGREVWASQKMLGDSVRFYYPVFWRDTVVFRTCGPDDEISRAQELVVRSAGEDGERHARIFKENAWEAPYWNWVRERYKLFTRDKHLAEQHKVREGIENGEALKTFYCLRVADGQEHVKTSITYSGSENGYSVPTPPCVDGDGNLYVLFKTLWTQFQYPIRSFDCLGTLDYETGIPWPLEKAEPGHRSILPITADEANMFTFGGNRLYDTHDHTFAYWDRDTKTFGAFAPKSRTETWGGILLTTQQQKMPANDIRFAPQYGPHATLLISTEWNGTSRGSGAIVGDYVWWATGSMIVCLKGAGE